MKYIIASSILTSTALAGTALNGWRISCQANAGDVDTAGPSFLASRRNAQNHIDMYFSSFTRGFAGVFGSSPYGVEGDEVNPCPSNNDTTVLVQQEWLSMPNEVDNVPYEVFGGLGYMQIPSGGPSIATRDGCVAIANTNNGFPVSESDIMIITGGCGFNFPTATKYYYHFAKWFDMDKDGDLDLITARGSGTDPTDLNTAELVWFENKKRGFQPGNNAWTNHVVAASVGITDTYMDVYLNGDTIFVISGSFSKQQLIIFSSDDWTNTDNVMSQVIGSDGAYFYEAFFDYDRDGVMDIIATIPSYGGEDKTGSLIVYPGTGSGSSWTVGPKVVVYDQFPSFSNDNLGSPGGVMPFWLGVADRTNGVIPNILISGMDDGYMYLASPQIADDGSFSWGYDVKPIYETKLFNPFVTILNAPTVGKPAIVDLNEDGCYEIAVAGYSTAEIVIIEQVNFSSCKRPHPTLPPKPTLPVFTTPHMPTHRP